MFKISQHLIDRYAAAPSATKTSQVASLQTTIRDVLGSDFETLLQGSYKNDTAIADINDVDIVARRKNDRSPQSSYYWESLFADIAQRLRTSSRIAGAVSIGDKCVKLTRSNAGLNADIVPALAIGAFESDPIAIYSRSRRTERPNYPRTHYANGVDKQRASGNVYKATVRLFKRWARQYTSFEKTAPSFYIECAVYNAPNEKFNTYLPLSFVNVGREICSWSRSKVIYSVARDKDVLVPGEWNPDDFVAFQERLRPDVGLAARAVIADTTAEADRAWKLAFGDS